MPVKTWEPIKTCHCSHIQHDVALEAEVVYPAEWLPEQAPRVLGHRCSHALSCNLDGRSSCVWAGTNPAIDPFIESLAPPI